MTEDVPLEHAMLCYDSRLNCGNGKARVAVILHPDRKRKSDGYTYSVGACYRRWQDRTNSERMIVLFNEIIAASIHMKVPIDELHNALLVIPEYSALRTDAQLLIAWDAD